MNNYTSLNPRQHLKNFFSKPIFLVMAILCAGAMVLSIISGFFAEPLTYGAYEVFPGSGSMIDQFESFDDITVSNNVSFMSPLIYSIAMFLLYFLSKAEKITVTPKPTFVIFKVFAIIGLVSVGFLSLVFFIIALMFGFFLAGIDTFGGMLDSIVEQGAQNMSLMSVNMLDSYAYDVEDYFGVGGTVALVLSIVILLFFVILLAACFIYLISMLKYSSSLNKSLEEPYLHNKGAKLFGVFSVIMGVSTILSLAYVGILFVAVEDFVSATPFYVLQILAGLCMGCYNILFGVMSVKYASYAKNVNNGLAEEYKNYYYNNPQYNPYHNNQNATPYQSVPYGASNNNYYNVPNGNQYAPYSEEQYGPNMQNNQYYQNNNRQEDQFTENPYSGSDSQQN
ncbi:MAG: hypothetical protein PUC88_00965 [Clostridia bacterium]|nr:hypothetical protein [Clostridia bacterium]